MTKQPSRRRPAGAGTAPPAHRGRRKGRAAGRTLFEISAGGVLFRRTARGIAICLLPTQGGTRRPLPKGKREDGGALEETAAREGAEGTRLLGRGGSRPAQIYLRF